MIKKSLILLLLVFAIWIVIWFVVPKEPIRVKTVYRVYIPNVIRPVGLFGQGVASVSGGQYQQELNATWYYVWGWWCGNNANCINMLRNGESVAPSCKQFIMLFNEPNGREPGGHPIAPEDAAAISQAIRAQCPNSWLIIGNLISGQHYGLTGIEWLGRFIAANGQHDQIGLHTYGGASGTAAGGLAELDAVFAAFPGKRWCITEFNVAQRDPNEFRLLYYGIRARVNCFAAFTDYDPNWLINYGLNLNLINPDRTRNVYGDIYAGQ